MTAFEGTLTLADGRRIGYAEYGDPSGAPLLYFHGWPGNHLEWSLFDPTGALALKYRLRVIAFDRPGYIHSDPSPGASLLDLAEDVSQIVELLACPQPILLGYSGGGPPALAAGARLRERAKGVILVACAGPFDRVEFRRGLMTAARMQYTLARKLPALYRLMNAQLIAHPERMVEGMVRALPDPDVTVLRSDAVREVLTNVTRVWGEGPLDGALEDARRAWTPLPFALAEVGVPVSLWQGGKDRNAPPVISQMLASALPNATLHFMPDEGHISIVVNHAAEILHSSFCTG